MNHCLRQILGVRWYDRLRNEELWRSTAQEPIVQQIKRREWRWLGHTLKKPADNVTRRRLRWTPQRKRKRGRPKTTWRRSTEAEAKVAGLTWGQLERKAQDRGGRQTLVDDLCSVRNDRNQCMYVKHYAMDCNLMVIYRLLTILVVMVTN